MPAMELNVGSHSVLLALCAIVHLLVCHCCSWSPPPHHHHHQQQQQQHSSTSSASSLSTFTTASVLRLNFNVSKITAAHPAFVRHHPHVTMLAYNSCVFAVTRFSFSFSFSFCFFLHSTFCCLDPTLPLLILHSFMVWLCTRLLCVIVYT